MRSLMVSRSRCSCDWKLRHLADGVLVEQLLEARHEARQVVGLQLVQHARGIRGPAATLASTSCVSSLKASLYSAIARRSSRSGAPASCLRRRCVPAASARMSCSRSSQDSTLSVCSPRASARQPSMQREVLRMGREVRCVQPLLRLLAQGQRLRLASAACCACSVFALLQLRRRVSASVGLQRRQLRGQRLQHVGRRFQPLLLVLQRGQLGGAAAPVEFGEVAVFLQLVQRLQALARLLLFLLQRGDALARFAQPRLQQLWPWPPARRSWPGCSSPARSGCGRRCGGGRPSRGVRPAP